MSVNPLLEVSSLPNFAPSFKKIKTEDYLPAVEQGIQEARAHIGRIKDTTAAPDFDNTIVALETSSETLGQVMAVFYNQLSAVGGDDLHELAEKIGPLSSNFNSDIILDEDLFKRIKAVYDQHDKLKLTPEQKTLLKETYKQFVRGGALLSPEKKKRLREVTEQLSVLGPSFMNNTSKSSQAYELWIDNENDLAGLPDGIRDAMKHAADEKGKTGQWLVTLDMPSYMPFMQYAENRTLREKVWRAYASRAWGDSYDNSNNVLNIVKLKHEYATLLGYKTYADYVLEERMAEKADTVFEFLDKLKKAYKPAAVKDYERLKEFSGIDIKPWDVAFYSEKLKEKLFEFSEEDLRPYFPLDKVLSGCFDHFSKLFGIVFKPASGYETWHKDVQSFDLFDAADSKFVGTLFADFFPRKGKKDGAWKTGYRAQGLYQGKIERPVIAIVCNFTKPTPDKPSLLTHNEVLTLFHEMGHAMHALLSNVTYSSLAGTNVLWDFVELPSQVQENWCYEKETLDMFAGHYKTGEKIPVALIEKLRAAKNYMVGWTGLRQICFSVLDMAWYSQDPSGISDVAAFEDTATKDLVIFPRMAGPFSNSFGHIFGGGYAAGYYSYKWAEVLDSDTFELFLEKGLYDRETAKRYQNEILAKGGSEHPKILYRNFRGRDADPEALIRREGLKDSKAA